MSKHLFSLAILSASTLLAIEPPHVAPCDPGFNTRGFVGFRGPKGVGYEKSYGTFGLFFSPLGQESARAFIDLRGHIFTDGRWAANGGLGVRVAYKEENAFGLNVYYDFRDVHQIGGINQVGAGAEYLTPNFDVRMNGYAPVGGKQDIRNPYFHKFQGHRVIAKQTVEAPLPVIDAEVGVPIGGLCGQWDLYCAVGGYYLFENNVGGKDLGNRPGVKARAFVRPLDSLTIGGDITYDNIFHVRGQAYATVSLPLGPTNLRSKGKRFRQMFPGSCYQKAVNIGLMTQPVYRNEIIPVQKGTGEYTVGCNDPCCCANFIVVDSSSTTGGQGTFERPYQTLIDAETFSQPGDIIYVRPSSGPNRYNQGIVLKPGQQLISSSIPYEVCGICLPACTPGRLPLITNELRPDLGTSAVTEFVGIVTNGNNAIAGFTINGSSSPGFFSGIDINNSNTLSISKTDIFDVTFGIIGTNGKIGANINIDNVLIDGISPDPSIGSDAQLHSGGISLAWKSPIIASSINMCNSKIIGAPAYPIYLVGGLVNSELNLTYNQLLGGHRSVVIGGNEITGSTLSLFGNTMSGLTANPSLGAGFTEAGFYVNGTINASSLCFTRNAFSLITGVNQNVFGVRIANNPVRNSTLTFDRNTFANIGNGSILGNGIFVRDLESSTINALDNRFFDITNNGVRFENVNNSCITIQDSSFQGIGYAGIEFNNNMGVLQNSSLAIEGNSFTNSPSALAFWLQQSPVRESCVTVRKNYTLGEKTPSASSYLLLNEINRSVITFCENRIEDMPGGVILGTSFPITNSAILFDGNSFRDIQYGIALQSVTIKGSTIVFENNQISNLLLITTTQIPPTGITLANVESTSSEFVFRNNCINPGLSNGWGIGLVTNESSIEVRDSTFAFENNHIANGDTGILFKPISTNVFNISNKSLISFTGNKLENLTTGILFNVFYNGSDPATLRIQDNCFLNLLDGIDITFSNAIIGSTPTANISRNCFDGVTGTSLFFNQNSTNPMTIKVNDNETFNFTGSVDFSLRDTFGNVQAIGNSLDGAFYLQGAFCLDLFDNAASKFTLDGLGSARVESPNSALSGVERMNQGTIMTSGVTYVLPGTCSP